jgi:hypothetical protein
MTLKNALNYLEDLKSQTNKNSEIQVYEKFLHVIGALYSKDFSKDEMQSIELELDSLESSPENRKKHVGKTLAKFEHYLHNTFSFTPKGYYTNLGLIMGSTFGVFIGIITLSIFDWSLSVSLGISFGALIGLMIGHNMDSRAKAAGTLL